MTINERVSPERLDTISAEYSRPNHAKNFSATDWEIAAMARELKELRNNNESLRGEVLIAHRTLMNQWAQLQQYRAAAEPTAYIIQDAGMRSRGNAGFLSYDGSISDEDINEYEISITPLYAAPQVTSVPDESAIFDAAIDICRKSDAIDEHAWNRGVLAVMSAFKACRAAIASGKSPAIPDGYALVPIRLTAENGAKGLLSGEFSETKFISCPECFGDDECETCDGSGRIEITVPVSWTTIKEIWAKGVEHFAAPPQQEAE